MCCTRLAGNTGRKKSPSAHHPTNLSGYIFAAKARIDSRKKKLVKQQYIPHMSSQYGELGPPAAEICWRVWGTAANFNEVRVLAWLLQRRCSPEAKQTLHDVWSSPRLVCIHFRGPLAIMFLPCGFYLSSFFFFFFLA